MGYKWRKRKKEISWDIGYLGNRLRNLNVDWWRLLIVRPGRCYWWILVLISTDFLLLFRYVDICDNYYQVMLTIIRLMLEYYDHLLSGFFFYTLGTLTPLKIAFSTICLTTFHPTCIFFLSGQLLSISPQILYSISINSSINLLYHPFSFSLPFYSLPLSLPAPSLYLAVSASLFS